MHTSNSATSTFEIGATKTEAPLLVFLHYFSGASMSWKWVIDLLQSEFPCFALDLPGFGNEMAIDNPSIQAYSDFVWNKLISLNINSFVLVGHSMGGKIALNMASNLKADGLQRLILLAPSPPTREPMPTGEKERLLSQHPSRDSAEVTVNNAIQRALTDEQRETAIRTHINVAESAWRWWLLEGMNHSIADKLTNISVPVTVIASPDDPVIPYDVIRNEISLLIPVSILEFHGIGHLMPLEDPAGIADRIRRIAG